MAKKTTVCLSDAMKAAVKVEALRRGLSEAEVIRQAIADAVNRTRPRPGLIDGEPLAERTDQLLAGFGDR